MKQTTHKKSRSFLTYFFIFIFFINPVLALDNCKGGAISSEDVPCLILLPVTDSTDCADLTITIYRENVTIYTSILSNYSNSFCSNIFNQSTLGTYVGVFSTEDTIDIIVEEGNKMILLFYLLIGISVALLIIGLWKQDINIGAFSGMGFLGIGTFIIINGFSIYNNLLSEILGIMLIAIGAYIIGKFMEIQFDF